VHKLFQCWPITMLPEILLSCLAFSPFFLNHTSLFARWHWNAPSRERWLTAQSQSSLCSQLWTHQRSNSTLKHTSASRCSYHSITLHPPKKWILTDAAEDKEIPATIREPDTVLCVAPTSLSHFFNNYGLIYQDCEAKARECVAIALSPRPRFVMGKTYSVHISTNGNSSTLIRRRSSYSCVNNTFSSVWACTPNAWTCYWNIYHQGKISIGIGHIPSKKCGGTLNDSLYDKSHQK